MLFDRLAFTSPKTADLGLLLVRLWFGLALALNHGQSKLIGLTDFVDKVEGLGFPLPLISALFAGTSEFLGGLALAIGVLTRPAAACVLTTMLVAAFVVHADDPFSKQEFALAYAMAALAILISGPGRYSVDSRLSRRALKRGS